jgi:predicted ATP-dependent endonuclease of OLD family
MAQPNDFLIIDEPELNLHPDNQRKIARILAKAVNRGFKIMISTHSDYIIRELNNLIMLSQESEAATQLRSKLEVDHASTLKPEKIGVYLFNEHRSEAVPVTETGFAVKTIDDEINKLNSASQEIYFSLFD